MAICGTKKYYCSPVIHYISIFTYTVSALNSLFVQWKCKFPQVSYFPKSKSSQFSDLYNKRLGEFSTNFS